MSKDFDRAQRMSKDFDRALGQAKEYARAVRDRGANSAEAKQIRNTIDTLVGRWVDGRFVLPRQIIEAMRA